MVCVRSPEAIAPITRTTSLTLSPADCTIWRVVWSRLLVSFGRTATSMVKSPAATLRMTSAA